MIEKNCNTCKAYNSSYDSNPMECDASCAKEDELIKMEQDGVDTSEFGNTVECPIHEQRDECRTDGCKRYVEDGHLFCDSCREEMEIEQFEAAVSASNG